jgi:alpha-1,2-mannosyltransferase
VIARPTAAFRRSQVTDLGLAMVASLVAGAVILRLYETSTTAADYDVYRDAARAAWRGVDLYRIHTASPGTLGNPFTYPPVAALVLLPTTWVVSRTGYLVWTAVSMVTLTGALALTLPRSLAHRAWVLTAAVVLASTTCVMVDNVVFGQVNVALMALCLVDLRRRDDTRLARWVPRGVLVGLAAAIKVTPALFVVYFALTRQWRLLGWSLCGAAVATAAGAVVYPGMTVTFFRRTLWGLTDRVNLSHPTGYWGNSSVNGAVCALGSQLQPVAVVAILVVAGAALRAAQHAHRAGRELDAWLIVGLAASLVSPYSWTHHYVYLLPALTRLAVTREWTRRPWVVPVAGGLLLALGAGPQLGQSWLDHGSPALLVPGLLQREILVLLALSVVFLLAYSSPRMRPPTGARCPRRRRAGAAGRHGLRATRS